MQTLKFRYSEDINVIMRDNHSSLEILFKNKSSSLLKIIYRGLQKYFHGIVFNYDLFNSDDFCISYVKTTAKDGSAFLARLYLNGRFYAIRKKKRKPQIVFMKSGNQGFKNYQLGADVIDAVCLYNGVVSKDIELLNDFFQKRPIKEFNEKEFIDSLDFEDRKDYLESKKIEEVIEKIGKMHKLKQDDIEYLIFYIECTEEDNEIKTKVLDDNTNEDLIFEMVLPLINKAKKYNEDNELHLQSVNSEEDKEYIIDDKFIYANHDFNLMNLELNDEAYYLLYFFEDEYEQIKDYLNKGIERTKKTIDEALPYFKKYIEGIL